jgi:hypothetical protein
MTTVNAHFLGKVLVPDEPLDLPEGTAVELSIRRHDTPRSDGLGLLSRLPLIRLAPADAEAINRDPAFDIEEA